MELLLARSPSNSQCTLGELSINGNFEAFTCEDIVREVKIPGETAIPAGRYQVVVTFSNRFQRPLPLLLHVPNFDGVRIHPGNTAKNTDGCILPGRLRNQYGVGESVKAFEPLFEKIKLALAKGEQIWLEIKNG